MSIEVEPNSSCAINKYNNLVKLAEITAKQVLTELRIKYKNSTNLPKWVEELSKQHI